MRINKKKKHHSSTDTRGAASHNSLENGNPVTDADQKENNTQTRVYSYHK
jgi:hypothetical protein